jgi:DNA-binding XRE family transcriptional regulator
MTTTVDMTTCGCHIGAMASTPEIEAHRAELDSLRQIRHEALEHFKKARELHEKRRELMKKLLGAGLSQSDLARELGVTRQAIQKMLA